MDAIFLAASMLFDPFVLAVIVGSAAIGMVLGAIPGLTATMGIILLIPFIFYLDPLPAIAAIVSLTATAIFAGDIPGALMRIPGTPASAAYTDEAYQMSLKGKAELALGISLVTAACGGMIGALVLLFAAPPLADLALKFSSFEYFWLACLGLSTSIILTSSDKVKGFAAVFIGVLISSVGLDPLSGLPRFTAGSTNLLAGLHLVPVLVGLYAVSEVIRDYEKPEKRGDALKVEVGNVFYGVGRTIWTYRFSFVQGNLIGSLLGALPGAGADIASWISYAVSRKLSRNPEKFGTGHPEGLVGAGAANNSAISSAYVPTIAFGIPGDSLTAIVIGVLFVKGVNPGPTVFLNQPELVYAIIFSFFIANLIMIPMGFFVIKIAKNIVYIPRPVLLPFVIVFAMVGAFAATNTQFAFIVLIAMGILGWLMEANDIPIAPAVLGMILGPLIEESFLKSLLISNGSFLPFLERPIAGFFGVATFIVVLAPVILYLKQSIWQRTVLKE
jgi:putative tricarboxylic transport membrane protein